MVLANVINRIFVIEVAVYAGVFTGGRVFGPRSIALIWVFFGTLVWCWYVERSIHLRKLTF